MTLACLVPGLLWSNSFLLGKKLCSGIGIDAQTTPTAEKHNDLEGLLLERVTLPNDWDSTFPAVEITKAWLSILQVVNVAWVASFFALPSLPVNTARLRVENGC